MVELQLPAFIRLDKKAPISQYVKIISSFMDIRVLDRCAVMILNTDANSVSSKDRSNFMKPPFRLCNDVEYEAHYGLHIVSGRESEKIAFGIL